MAKSAFLLLLVSALVACGNGSSGPDNVGGGPGDDNGGGDPNGGGGGNGSGDGGGSGDSGCKKVDVLFSIDDSGSMRPKMEAMSSIVFPEFASKLLDVGGGLEDFRAGVTSACASMPRLSTQGDGGDCHYSTGQAWMDSTSPNLAQEFQCAGDIYSVPEEEGGCTGDNDDEQPATTAAAAVSGTWLEGDNMGFLRNDALLVVVAMTDEDEQPTPDISPQEIYDRIVATKGNVSRIVFLGIGGSHGCDEKAGAPETSGGAENATKLKAVTDLFIAQNRGVFWDLCEGNFVTGLDEAMQIIDSACEEYVPVLL